MITDVELAALIEEAFSDVHHAIEPVPRCDSYVDDEIVDCYKALEGLGWRDLSVDAVRTHFGCVSFLTTDERHAVFAAWLLAAINDEEQLVYHWTITILLPCGALWRRCSIAQRRAVREFLEYHIEKEDDPIREKDLLPLWTDHYEPYTP